MNDGFERNQESLRRLEQDLPPLPGQSGAVFALDGKVFGVELLANEQAFKKIYRKLIRSYAIDALDAVDDRRSEPTRTPEVGDAEAFLGRIASAEVTSVPGVGLGDDIRIEGERCIGHALIHDGALLHLAAFDNTLAN